MFRPGNPPPQLSTAAVCVFPRPQGGRAMLAFWFVEFFIVGLHVVVWLWAVDGINSLIFAV